MAEQYVEPIKSAAETVVLAAKLSTIGSAAVAGSAGWVGDHFFAWAGLFATLFFGALGTAVSFYYKKKEDHRQNQIHVATMAKLTSK